MADGQRIVVLGAGVLGLEFALAAAHAGARVAVVHHGPHPMPRNLDRGAGSVLRRAVRRTGVTVFAHSRAETVLFHTDEDGHPSFDRLLTADGKDIAGRPPRALVRRVAARGARRGRPDCMRRSVSSSMTGLRTWTDPSVFAIGDCAHIADQAVVDAGGRLAGAPSGLIGPGWRQADWLAARFLEGTETARIGRRSPAEREPLVMLKAEHVDVVAAGDVSADPWDEDPAGRQVAQWADPEHGRYVKMVSQDGILTGFVCVGMPRTAAELTLLYERGDELPADRSLLLRFDGPDFDPTAASAALSPDATVCWCNGVSVAQIDASITAGSDTVECVGRDTRAGTGCGGCRTRISDMLAAHAVESRMRSHNRADRTVRETLRGRNGPRPARETSPA